LTRVVEGRKGICSRGLSPNTIQGYRIMIYCSVFIISLRVTPVTIPLPEDVSDLIQLGRQVQSCIVSHVEKKIRAETDFFKVVIA
jgi:hypothetical protein